MQDAFEIVCVDDDLDVLEITSENIKNLDFIPVEFATAKEASVYIQNNHKKIALILSDLRMDEVNGFEFKKMIQDFASDIPFAIITGYWTKEMSAEAMELGIKAFLEKPILTDKLQEIITKFSASRIELLQDEREMIQGFIEESSPMLEEIENLILELEEDPHGEKTLSVYFRLLHTIKGTASCVGLINLGDYTHQYEDFIGYMREHKIPICTKSINVLLQGLDDLKMFFKKTAEQNDDQFIIVDKMTAKFSVNQDFQDEKVKKVDHELKTLDPTGEKKKDDEKMTVAMSILNEFMEDSGELTVIRNSILKTVKKIENKYRGDSDIEQLNDLLEGMYNVTSDIQEQIESMRRVPLKNTFRPFKRLVRDLSKKLGKEVELEIIGEDLLVDTTIAKLYSNTLIHLIRNSLDHGLETTENRINAGKSKAGNLTISVNENGENIDLCIIDDGNGINPEVIAKKAIDKGLYTEEEISQMSHLQIVNIVFDSGFSTAEVVSDLSGRGVGMDMVRGSFEEMGGTVFVKSEYQKGSTFVLSVPIPKSVLIINSLLVKSGDYNYIFHMDEVAEVVRHENNTENSKMYYFSGERLLHHNGESLEIINLSEILGHTEKEPLDKEVSQLVILRIGEKKFAVSVDEIYEFEEVVSRKIPESIANSDLYLGASLLGTGEVAMILAAEGIATRADIEIEKSNSSTQLLSLEENQGQTVQENEYMLFSYHQDKTPLCVPLEFVERFENIKVKDIQNTGTNILIKYFDSVLMLVNPAELLGYETQVNLNELSDNDNLEVIVVQTQSQKIGLLVKGLGEIVSTLEELNTDTIDHSGLLGSLYVNGRTICSINIEELLKLHKNKFITIDGGLDSTHSEMQEYSKAA